MKALAPHSGWRLSDSQWAKINARVGLPATARPEIESGIDGYRRSKQRRDKLPSAAEVRQKLEKVAKATKQLRQSLAAMTDEEITELRTSNFYWGAEFDRSSAEELDAHVRGMLEHLARQAAAVEDLVGDTYVVAARYSRKSPKHVDRFIQHLGRVLMKHGGPELSRAKPVLSMLTTIFEIADPSVTPQSIEEAVRRLSEDGAGND